MTKRQRKIPKNKIQVSFNISTDLVKQVKDYIRATKPRLNNMTHAIEIALSEMVKNKNPQ